MRPKRDWSLVTSQLKAQDKKEESERLVNTTISKHDPMLLTMPPLVKPGNFLDCVDDGVSGIYYIFNTLTNKYYIGQSKNIKKRWFRHRKDHKYRESKIYSSMRKHGFVNFRFGVLLRCDIEELNKWEIFYITIFNSVENGYNLTSGGDCYIMSEEIRKKISISNTGKTRSLETKLQMSKDRQGEKHPRFGKTTSTETIQKIKDTIRKSYDEGYISPTNKKVEYLGQDFPALKHLASYLNLSSGQLQRRIKSNKIKVTFI